MYIRSGFKNDNKRESVHNTLSPTAPINIYKRTSEYQHSVEN